MEPLIKFFDYSDRAPDTILIGQVIRGKFVQVLHEKQGEFFLFAPQTVCVFHAQIMDLFCNEQSPPWAFELYPRGDDGCLHEEDAKIIGGGYFEIYEDKKRLNLSGSSKAFGSYHPYGLDHKFQSLPRFEEYTVFC